MDGLTTLAFWFVAGLMLVAVVYAAVRGASVAYFRTKLEYLRTSLKEKSKGDNSHGL